MSAFHAWANAIRQQQQQQLGLLSSQQYTSVIVQPIPQQPSFVVLQQAPQMIAMNAQATVSSGFTHTYLLPSYDSSTIGCVVPAGFNLLIWGITTDGQ